ncbi:Phosphoglycerate kinase [Candidatus Annandia adelgestsuga]|uniref:Phosphoglycerate kinase n=1 Tax=Candidatus Annandia adelgestsuga TaxID=1302411 RepID=A0A3S9J7K5_9ENTR|nr:phosphoglycerate kinase [Candidatus Annandia adelgestsuga]AZP36270.1 Phosphoglycerate kinase [Candidatus Annandia adelgestsuga]
MLSINNINIKNKRVLIRSDLNVPINNKKISSDTRILASLPTIKLAIKKKAIVIIMSHLGRPKENEYNENYSLKYILNYLKKKIKNIKIILVKKYLNGFNFKYGNLYILENVRFNKGEKKNSLLLSKKYASLCDIFVMDAFGSSHRKQSSTYGVSLFAKISCAGLLLISEINTLNKYLNKPKRPMTVILGGSKISTKFNILKYLNKISDYIIVGGGIANNFIAIKNKVGNSLYEKKYIEKSKKLLKNNKILIPKDVYVGKSILYNEKSKIKNIKKIKENDIILDFGIKTILNIIKIIINSNTILWNGPIGMFELMNFKNGTKIISKIISLNKCFSIIGGGDTISAISIFSNKKNFSYISTGGGSFLQLLEGKILPIVKLINNINFLN